MDSQCGNYIKWDERCTGNYGSVRVCTNHYVIVCNKCGHKK